MFINLTKRHQKEPQADDIFQQEEEREAVVEDPGEQEQPEGEEQEQVQPPGAQGLGTPRREVWQDAHGPWREKAAKLSPRERKRRQRRDHMPYQLRSRKGDGETVESD